MYRRFSVADESDKFRLFLQEPVPNGTLGLTVYLCISSDKNTNTSLSNLTYRFKLLIQSPLSPFVSIYTFRFIGNSIQKPICIKLCRESNKTRYNAIFKGVIT